MKTLVGSDEEPYATGGVVGAGMTSYMVGNGDCEVWLDVTVHPGRDWRRPASCDTNTCPEVAISPHGVHLRSTQAPAAVVTFSHAEWTTLVHAIENGEFRVPE